MHRFSRSSLFYAALLFFLANFFLLFRSCWPFFFQSFFHHYTLGCASAATRTFSFRLGESLRLNHSKEPRSREISFWSAASLFVFRERYMQNFSKPPLNYKVHEVYFFHWNFGSIFLSWECPEARISGQRILFQKLFFLSLFFDHLMDSLSEIFYRCIGKFFEKLELRGYKGTYQFDWSTDLLIRKIGLARNWSLSFFCKTLTFSHFFFFRQWMWNKLFLSHRKAGNWYGNIERTPLIDLGFYN